MNVLVLGPLEVRRDGDVVPVRRGRPRRLLLSLLLQRGTPVSPATLVDQLWGTRPPVNADNALQVLVSYLRRVLAGDELRLEWSAAGYRLLVDPARVDAFRFEQLVRGAQAAPEAPEQLRLAGEALALWRGRPLSEAAEDDYAQGEISRLGELRLTAAELRGDALLAMGRHAEAVPDLGELVREHPFRERFAEQLVLALYRSGRQAEALAALDRTRRVFAEELGLDPGPELRRLAERVLRQDPGLLPPVGTAPAVAPPTGPAPATADEEPADPAGRAPAPVPVPLTALLGRDDDLAAAGAALAASRLVTLTGPGGAGKTRLAVELAGSRAGEAWWTDLSGLTGADPAGVAAAVAGAAVLPLPPGTDPVDGLRRAVGDRQVLLVLDTCEHVLAAAADLVTGLAAGCPGLRVLATSRRRLGVRGERVHPVPPLGLPGEGERDPAAVARSAAVALFCERAAAVRPGFALDAGNAADVAAVCRLLDGLPLALELAAGAAGALSPRTIAALLTDRLRLVGGGQGRSGRHAGLRAAIDWSYELLSPEEALVLDRLSVFAGPFPVEAAVEVAGAGLPGDALEPLLALVAHSLLAVVGEDRFRLLDTVRAYAAERLAARGHTEGQDARARHARWYADLARDADRNIRGADQEGWLAELRLAAPDLRAALTACLTPPAADPATGAALVCSLSWAWSFDGRFAEAAEWIAAALAAGPHEVRTTALLRLAAGTHAESLGRLAVAERECTAAAEVFADLGDARNEAESLLHVGTARWALGDLPGAAAAQDRSIALFRSAADDGGAALALVLRARTALEAGDPQGARTWLGTAEDVLARAGDEHLTALALEQSARCALFVGDLDEAERLGLAGHRLFERLGYPEGVVAALLTQGRVRAGRGDVTGARARYRQSVRRALELSHRAAVAEGLELLADTARAEDRPQDAARLLGAAAAQRARYALPLLPLQQRLVGATEAAVRAALDGAFDRMAAAGRDRPVPELLALLP
ncbi:BTAD domain-containing putative transcriptional regulator [Geodermatophilus sp. SYSU D00965]